MMNPSKKIESKYWLDKEGVLRIKIDANSDVHITLEDAELHVKRCIALTSGLPRLLLIDLRAVSGSISKEASEFIKSSTELNTLVKAEGFITDTLATHLTLWFAFSYSQFSYPSKIFPNQKRAWQWLKDFK